MMAIDSFTDGDMNKNIHQCGGVPPVAKQMGRRWCAAVAVLGSLVLGGCATPVATDYSAFRQSRPVSLLVLPPINESTDVLGSPAVLAQATAPLAEAGYYVIPVSLMQESFRENGLTTPQDIQEVSAAKLREVFGADAAVYLKVTQYGTKYNVVSSESRVTVEGRIMDLRSGQQIWAGKATASSAESGQSSGGLAGMLISAVVNQIVGQATDASFGYAALTNQRLFGTPRSGVLAGPRSARYKTD